MSGLAWLRMHQPFPQARQGIRLAFHPQYDAFACNSCRASLQVRFMVKVRLTRKFAQMLNGIDLSKCNAGEDIDVSAREADLLIKEGWASPVETADDRAPRRPKAPGVAD